MKTLGFYNKKLVDVSNIVMPILIYSLEQHKTQANISKTTKFPFPVQFSRNLRFKHYRSVNLRITFWSLQFSKKKNYAKV